MKKPARGGAGRAVVRAAGIMIVATLASRVLGQLREALIAAWFGQSGLTDVYTASFSLPDTMFFLLAGGAFSSSFIPVFSQYLNQGQEDEAWNVFSIVATFLFLVIAGLVIVGEVFAGPLVRLLVPWFSPEKMAMTTHLTRIILPAQIAFFMGGLLMGTLYVRGRFLVPALGPIIYNLGIILGGWWIGRSHGIAGLSWGALVGAVIGNFLLQAAFLKGAGVRFRPSLNLRHPGVVKIGKLVLPVLLGLSLPQVYAIVNRMFGSSLGSGTITALDRANKLMQAPLGIFAQGIGIAIFPALSALVARGELGEYRKTFLQGLRAMWFITLPMSILMMILSREIVAVLLEYGKLKPTDASMIAVALIFYCTGLFAFSSQALLNRAFYAIQDTITPVVIGTLTTVVFVGLNFVLVRSLDFRGLALAGSLAAILHVVWMLSALRWKAKMPIGELKGPLAKFVLASAAGGAAAWAARWGVHAGGAAAGLHAKVLALVSLGLVSAIGGGVFLLAAHRMRCEEIQYVGVILKRKLRRGK